MGLLGSSEKTEQLFSEENYQPTRIVCEYCGELRVKGAKLCGHCGRQVEGKRKKPAPLLVHLDWESGYSAGFGFIIVLPIMILIVSLLLSFGVLAFGETTKTVRDGSGHLIEGWDQRSDTRTDVRGPHGHLKETRTIRGNSVYVRDGNGRLLRIERLE